MGRSRKPTNARLRRLRAYRRFIGRNRPHGSNMIPRRCRKDRGITVLDQKRRSSQSEPETVSAESETQPRQRANGGLSHHIRTSLHPRSICIGETGFLGPETDRPKSPSGQKRSPRRPKRSRKCPPIAGFPAVSGKSSGSKDCVVDLIGFELPTTRLWPLDLIGY